jgi:uncharacterized membrane protein
VFDFHHLFELRLLIMLAHVIEVLTVAVAVASGVVAGVFFAFSNFVMRGLAKLAPANGIVAMQSLNLVVINPIFLGLFVGTAAGSIVLAILAIVRWSDGSRYRLIGAALYVGGTFLVTILRNIPLNNVLARVVPESDDAGVLWLAYVVRWTRWNHIRTLAAIAAAIVLILAYNA